MSLVSSDVWLGLYDVCLTAPQHRGCLLVLHSAASTAKHKREKLIIGDQAGTLQCLTIKKSTPEIVFKMQPAGTNTSGSRKEISALSYGNKDRIYCASAPSLYCVQRKKGTLLGQHTPLLNENITAMQLDHSTGTELHVACAYSYSSFTIGKSLEKVQDHAFYQAPDTILCLKLFQWNKTLNSALIGTQDKYVRIINDNNVLLEKRLDAPVTCLYSNNNNGEGNTDATENTASNNANKNKISKHIYYGTDKGSVGELMIDSGAITHGFSLTGGIQQSSGVTCLSMIDLTDSGREDLVVGRDNGRIEIYNTSKDPDTQFQDAFEPIWSKDLNESIVSLQSGHILNTNQQDIVLATYSGKVVTFSSEIKGAIQVSSTLPPVTDKTKKKSSSDTNNNNSNSTANNENEQNIGLLKSEIDNLKLKIEKEKEKYSKNLQSIQKEEIKENQKLARSNNNNNSPSLTEISSGPTELIATEAQFKIKHTFKLVPKEGCYLLSIEITHPLEIVSIQSNIHILILESESNTAIVSRVDKEIINNHTNNNNNKQNDINKINDEDDENDVDLEKSNGLLAVYRFNNDDTGKESVNRMEIKIRTIEGEFGRLNICIIPKLTPKTAQFLSVPIKPLSLHERIDPKSVLSSMEENRATNSLVLKGNFSLSQMHNWIALILPDLPHRMTTEEGIYVYQSIFTRSLLFINYKEGNAEFQSDSPSTVSVIKEICTKEATKHNVNINPYLTFNAHTINTYFQLLRPQLDENFQFSRKMKLIAPLKELETHEENIQEFLSAEYLEIIKNSENIIKKYKLSPNYVEFLKIMLMDLYRDCRKLKGKMSENSVNVKKLQVLLKELETEYEFEKLVNSFKELL